MTKSEYVEAMKFPSEWLKWEMLDSEFLARAVENYRPGHEDGSEHDRNGAFHFWLGREPSKGMLLKLAKLSFLDPDQDLAEDVREHIRLSPHFDAEVARLLEQHGAA